MLAGLQLYLEEIGYQAAGRKIELIVEDDEAVPATSLTKTRKLVEKDGVHIMTGGLMSSTGYALPPYIDAKEIPMTYPIMAPDDLTQRQRPKWIVRTGWNCSQANHPFGEYAYQVLKFRKVTVVGLDFAFGWENAGGFQKTFEEAGEKLSRRYGCLSRPPISVPTWPRSRRMSMRFMPCWRPARRSSLSSSTRNSASKGKSL